MGTTLRVEGWSALAQEITPMLASHLAELGGGELALDSDLCWALDASGSMMILAARDDATYRLLGYCIWTFGPSLEHAGELIAELKPWYVRPENRSGGLALKLFKESLMQLRARGIKRCFPHHWGNETLGKFFTRLGARPIEWVYEMEL